MLKDNEILVSDCCKSADWYNDTEYFESSACYESIGPFCGVCDNGCRLISIFKKEDDGKLEQ